MAVIITLVVYDPLVAALAFTITLQETMEPAARLEPDASESETQDGALLANVADQLSGLPPVLFSLIDDDVIPGTLSAILEGVVTNTGAPGGLSTNVTRTVCVPAEELKVRVPV